MTHLESYIEYLRQIAAQAPPTAVVLPPNSVGLPEGTFNVELLIKYIADCLDGLID